MPKRPNEIHRPLDSENNPRRWNAYHRYNGGMEYIPTPSVHRPGIFVHVRFRPLRCCVFYALRIPQVPSEARVVLLWEKTCSTPFERSCARAEQLTSGNAHGRIICLLPVCACFIQVDCFIHHA